MAWTTFPTWVIGQVSTASDWNTYVLGNVTSLAQPPYALVYRNAASTGSSANPIPYDTILAHDATYPTAYSVSTFLYTVPVAGTYFVNASWVQSGAADGGWLNVGVVYNAVAYSDSVGINNGAAGGVIQNWAMDLVGPCAVNDTLSAWYSASNSLATSPGPQADFMHITKVSN